MGLVGFLAVRNDIGGICSGHGGPPWWSEVCMGWLVEFLEVRNTIGGFSGGQKWMGWALWQSEMTLVGFVVATVGPLGGQRYVWGGLWNFWRSEVQLVGFLVVRNGWGGISNVQW